MPARTHDGKAIMLGLADLSRGVGAGDLRGLLRQRSGIALVALLVLRGGRGAEAQWTARRAMAATQPATAAARDSHRARRRPALVLLRLQRVAARADLLRVTLTTARPTRNAGREAARLVLLTMALRAGP